MKHGLLVRTNNWFPLKSFFRKENIQISSCRFFLFPEIFSDALRSSLRSPGRLVKRM